VTKNIRTRLSPWIVIAGCIVAAGSARGESKPDKAIGGLVAIGGGASQRDRDVVGSAVATAARSSGWTLPPKPLTKQEVDGLVNCTTPEEPWRCIPLDAEARGIHHALVVTVEPQQSTSGVAMLVLAGTLIATNPAALVVHQRICERCTDDKLAEASSELAVQLLNELAARAGRTLIEVKSVPPGAIVTVDRVPSGATDDVFATFPGTHTVRIEKAGFATETLQVETVEGKTVEVAVTLRPQASRLIPLSLIGAGVALVAGGTLIYFDQQDGVNDKYRHSRATPVGVSVGVVGLAAVATGVYLWRRDSTASKPKHSTPTVSVSDGGAVVGWTSTF